MAEKTLPISSFWFTKFFFYKESLQCCDENIPLEGASSLTQLSYSCQEAAP